MNKFLRQYYIVIIFGIFIICIFILFQKPKNIIIQPNTSVSSNISVSTTLSPTTSHQSAVASNNQQSLSKFLYKVKTAPSPKGLMFTPNGQEIWVTSLLNTKRGIAVHSGKSYDVITNIALNNYGGVEVVINKEGSKAYVSQMETGSVFEIDTKTKSILRVFKTNSSWTKVIVLSYDERKLYASNWSGDNVSEFDLITGKLIRNIKTVKTPRGIYSTKDNKYLYVAGYDKGELQKINLQDETSQILYNQGAALRHIVVDEKRDIMYISDMGKNNILKLDLKNDSIINFAKTDENPNTIVLSPDGNLLFVSCRGTNYSADNYSIPGPDWGTVLIFDTNSGRLVDAIIGGNQPTAMGVSPDSKMLVFSDFLDGILEFYQIPNYNDLRNNESPWLQNYKKFIKKSNF